ncbi:hypothetical protein C8R46DRAFT_1244790 [Mycena filopes]|nr:hypothetical protein C8R46DRAFT_1027494 [Mycena filopes]KAJ7189215.1 hypothetical protein C8R46DRAFT_1244790 [Mycena filopes]
MAGIGGLSWQYLVGIKASFLHPPRLPTKNAFTTIPLPQDSVTGPLLEIPQDQIPVGLEIAAPACPLSISDNLQVKCARAAVDEEGAPENVVDPIRTHPDELVNVARRENTAIAPRHAENCSRYGRGGAITPNFSDLSDPMDPNIDDNAAVLPPSNYDGTAESYAQDSFAMDVDTDSSASHEDSSDTDSSIPDIESDYESDTEPFGAAFGMDLEEWKSFDEDGDHDVPLTRDEMIAELEEMLGPDEEGKLWERSA